MADIRISALPNEPAPSGSDFVAIDLASTRKTTITLLTEAGRPTASQAEAEAGVNPTKAMTPLTTKQAITSYGPTLFQPLSTKLTNLDGTALTAGALLFGAGVNTWSTLPLGSNNQYLQIVGGNPTWTNGSASGDVTGPASSITGSIPTFNGTTGKVIQAGNPTMSDFLSASRGPMSTIANNGTDAVNDIDFSTGAMFSTDASHWPIVALAALTKQLDASWAVGNNAGGRMSAAAITNTTYHCFAIRRPDTGVVDFGFDVSPTAPTLPTNYTQYVRIGSIIRAGGTIIAFKQTGSKFMKVTATTDRSSTSAAATALLTLVVPIGIIVNPILESTLQLAASSSSVNSIGDGNAGGTQSNFQTIFANSVTDVVADFSTDTSARIWWATTISIGTITSNVLKTLGWYDDRGLTS
jgi:hypothetical protein